MPHPTGPVTPVSHEPVLIRSAAKEESVGAGMTVRRALPRGGRRTVGAWCFLDHFGPADALDVGEHPHIGLETVTWLTSGEVEHADSLGTKQVIRPGQVNWMTAGRGIAHTERGLNGPLHGVQLWVALPAAQREVAPAFAHAPTLPVVQLGGVVFTVIAGEIDGLRSPVHTWSPLVGVDAVVRAGAAAAIPVDPEHEHAVVVMEGEVEVDGERLRPGELLYLGMRRREVKWSSVGGGRAMLIGGVPYEDPLWMWWNFVGGSWEEIRAARDAWQRESRRFAPVEGSWRRLDAPELPPGV